MLSRFALHRKHWRESGVLRKIIMAKQYKKLRAYYSRRENDTMFEHPYGLRTKADAHYLHGIFTKEMQSELEARGYDWQTFKFEISPKLPNDRFPTLSAEIS